MNEKQEQIQEEIFALKCLLADTDYQCMKYTEGALTVAEFADTRAKRAAWREKINALEGERNALAAEGEKTMK
jgi:hypothetical protein